MRRSTATVAAATLLLLLPIVLAANDDSSGTWTFGVSGDSRNCGDVVMPEIAADVLKRGAAFYWHLGDFRAIYTMDEDFLHQAAFDADRGKRPPAIATYLSLAWPDFVEHQVKPFGALPVFLGIGNHETVPPKSREQYERQFYAWLDSLPLAQQRAADYKWNAEVHPYYHWIRNGVDFITLDNGSGEQFDPAQLAWFEAVLESDAREPAVRTIVVGMHKALPYSQSFGHSMNETRAGRESGLRVYTDLLKLRDGKFIEDESAAQSPKRVYVLASHSHYYLKDLFRTPYWEQYGLQHYGSKDAAILEGYIVGTAGAVRYEPPAEALAAGTALRKTYGYLLGAVQPDGQITFAFEKIHRQDVTQAVQQEYTPQFVDWCFEQNPPPADAPK